MCELLRMILAISRLMLGYLDQDRARRRVICTYACHSRRSAFSPIGPIATANMNMLINNRKCANIRKE